MGASCPQPSPHPRAHSQPPLGACKLQVGEAGGRPAPSQGQFLFGRGAHPSPTGPAADPSLAHRGPAPNPPPTLPPAREPPSPNPRPSLAFPILFACMHPRPSPPPFPGPPALQEAQPQAFWLKAARGRVGATLQPPSRLPPSGGPMARVELIGLRRHQGGGVASCGPVYGLVGWWCLSIASSNINSCQHSLKSM